MKGPGFEAQTFAKQEVMGCELALDKDHLVDVSFIGVWVHQQRMEVFLLLIQINSHILIVGDWVGHPGLCSDLPGLLVGHACCVA